MTAAPIPNPVTLDDPSLYFNRELSWLEFNRRVLEEAFDPDVPLLERLKFLAIFSSNLDEFFMVRVGGLHQKVQANIPIGSGADRMLPLTQLRQVNSTVRELVAIQYKCLTEQVLPALREKGIFIREAKELDGAELKHLAEVFRSQIFPVLTPLATDPTHPFPHLLNKSLNLAVMLRRPGDAEPLFALVQVPSLIPRLVPLNTPTEQSAAFIPLETLIRLHLGDLFPGMDIQQVLGFRVTRDSEYELDDEVEDLLRAIEENVKLRRLGHPVRLEIEADAPPEVEQFLIGSLNLHADDVTRVPGMIDLTGMFQVHALPGFPELRDPPFVPTQVRDFVQASSIFAAIRAKDILVHHPYESFKHVVDFIETAAADEKVLAIKQTLYRTSSDSPIVKALQRAADNGKQVTAVIELKARLDEERNILWAKALEKAGVHVVFGFIGLKTHCKVASVIRADEDGVIRQYMHLATGNYNPQTARYYTDLGLFTANTDFAHDVTLLFNHLTGYAELPQYRKLVVAPGRMQNFMIERIEREASNQKAGRKSRIAVKVNGLLEPVIVKALYRASQAGVVIDIMCRGICALRPGVPGVSENIRVISVIDRFLEHSRIFYFENAGEPEVYIGSADWMDRNLSRRVEVVFPIEQPDLKARLIDEILGISLRDTAKCRELNSEGNYTRVQPPANQPPLRSQVRFLELAMEAEKKHLLATRPAEPATPATPKLAPRSVRRKKG
jgi:polyphosphate kinase